MKGVERGTERSMNLQLFAAASGVYPCYENQFQIDTAKSDTSTMKSIADCVTFGVSIDNGVEEWTPFETEGWVRRLMTAKSLKISVTAKRNAGDAGNDFVAGKAFKSGKEAEADFQWTFPDETIIKLPKAVISVTNLGGGDSTSVADLEFEIMSNGKPEVTGTEVV